MFNKTRNGLIALGLSLPLITTAMAGGLLPAAQAPLCKMPSADSMGAGMCDVTFSFLPNTFSSLCLGGVYFGLYSITNNTPVPMKLNYIRIAGNDGMPSSSTAILVASENSCSTSTPLASGASCNILVRLNALQLLPFNRTLQIGIDSRQVQLDAPAITTTVGSTCTTPTPAPTPAPIPAPTPTPPGLLAEPLIFGAAGVTGGGASPYTSVAGDVDGYPVTTTSITDFPPATLTGTINAADTGGGTVAAAAAAAATALLATETTQGLACLAAGTRPANPNNLTGLDLGNISSVANPLPPGTYCFSSSAGLTGTLYLGTSPTSTYLFYMGSTLITATSGTVTLVNGAIANNVNWAVGSAATFGVGSTMQGTVVASAAITDNGLSTVNGRLWSSVAAVTLNSSTVTNP